MFQQQPVRRYDQHPVVEGATVIAADFHAPFHDVEMCNRMLKVARRYKIDRLILAGDGLDMHAFSKWGDDPGYSWNEEILHSAQWLWTLYDSFKEIIWLRGNHSDRMGRATNWHITFDQLIPCILERYVKDVLGRTKFTKDFTRIRPSEYPFCYLDNEWMVVHPRSYSRIPLRIANQLALIHNKHIIMAHSHRQGMTWADDGKHIIIDSGGMCDAELVQYQKLSITTHGRWNKGFVVYKDGHAVPFGAWPWTDWGVHE